MNNYFLSGLAIVIHHVLVIIISIYPLYAQMFTYISVCYLINELSTPFMNNIRFFKDCEIPKEDPIVKLNSILFVLLFFFCRVCVTIFVLIKLTFFTAGLYQVDLFVQISSVGFAFIFMVYIHIYK